MPSGLTHVQTNNAQTTPEAGTGRSGNAPTATPLPTRRNGRRIQLDTGWQELSNCLGVDPDLFFPERGASTREAKEVCRGCVVREECLEFALVNGEKFGIWGGMSERERRRIRRQRSLERQAARAAAVNETA